MSSVLIRANRYLPKWLMVSALLFNVVGVQPAIAKKAPQPPFPPIEHIIGGDSAQIFQSTIAALEDAGFIIEGADSNSGFIRATTPIKDSRSFFEDVLGRVDYKSTSATVTMIPNGNGSYTLRLRLIKSRTESTTGIGDYDESGEQRFQKIDRSEENYARIFNLIDARMAGIKSGTASLETASKK